MITKEDALELILSHGRTSKDIYEFSLKLIEYIDLEEDSKIWEHFKYICLKLMEYDVKIALNPQPGMYELVGGGNLENDYVTNIEDGASKGSLGYYSPGMNLIFLSANIDDISKSVPAYGIDTYMLEKNFMLAYVSIFIHELLHAIEFNQSHGNISDNQDVIALMARISKAAKINNLAHLKPIDAYWGETISHLISNKKYYSWIVDNNLSFDLSKIINKTFVYDEERDHIINFINIWTKYFYEENTDIVYFIPDHSKSDNFLSREFYSDNDDKILGQEISTTNRWNKFVFKTKRHPSDNSLEEILARVQNLPSIDFELMDNLMRVDKYENSHEASEINESIQRSIKKAKSGVKVAQSDLISFRESVELYNIKPGFLTWIEIEAYLFCYPGENKLIWKDKLEYTEEQILASNSTITLNKMMENECEVTVPTVIFDGEEKHFFSIFLHGDVFKKTEKVKYNEEIIIEEYGADYYNRLITGLKSISFVSITFSNEDYNKRPFISPVSEIAKEFMIENFVDDSRSKKITLSLLEAFVTASNNRSGTWFKSSKYNGVIASEMREALQGKRLIEKPFRGSKLTKSEKAANEEADSKNANRFDAVFEQTCIAFSDFIKECLNEHDRGKLEEQISGFYNKFCFTELEKVPVGFTHSTRFKTSNRLHLKTLQRNSVAFESINKTGLLAHEIGTGKTLSALMSVSNAFDVGRANKALFVVPTPVYEKWIDECRNHNETILDPDTGEKKEVTLYGALPHINVVGLSNLSDKILLELKEYSKEEKEKISKASSSYIKFNNELNKIIKDIEEDVEEEEEEYISDGVDSEVKATSKSKLPVNFTPDIASDPLIIKDIINGLLSKVMIEVLEHLGITNESSKNFDSIYSVLNNQFMNNTLSSTFKSLYSDAGWPLDKVKHLTEFPDYVHISVIISYIKKHYKRLESHLIATTGTFREFPDKTIFFTTYTGLARLGFKKETIDIMSDKLLTILKGSDMSDQDEAKTQENIKSIIERSELDAKVFFEDLGFDYIAIDEAHRLKNLITSITAPEVQKYSVDDMYPGNRSQINTIKGGTQSKQALTGFMSTMYVQMKNGGRNTLLLTATPFTNSPLEIFSMLSMTCHNYLVKLGYDNVLKFAQDFIKIKSQLSVSVDGSIKTKIEPVGYNNLNLLRRIIYTIIDFRSAEESNIVRPCKITLPIREKSTLCDSRKSHGFSVIRPVSTIVVPTKAQQFLFDALQHYLAGQIQNRTVDDVFYQHMISKGDEYYRKMTFAEKGINYEEYMTSVEEMAETIKGYFNITKQGPVEKLLPPIAILKVLMAMRNISISPYMFRPYVTGYLGINDDDIDKYQVINQSSKLLYVLSCIKKANSMQRELGKPYKGFVIYSNLGTKAGKNSPVSLLKIIKEYLLDENNGFDYKSNAIKHTMTVPSLVKGKTSTRTKNIKFSEVEILDGSTNKDKRKALMDEFNKGNIKVVITTIKEGVDLNGDTIAGFNISVDWNPTDSKQIEGRWHRQGNANAYTISAYPLTANGSDMAIYQKLQDKTYRLKSLWDKSTSIKSAFDLDDFNPEELKMQMISRVEKLAPFIYHEETTEKRFQYDILKSKREEDGKIIENYKGFLANESVFRESMTLFTRLPKILEKENKLSVLNGQLADINNDIEYNKGQIEYELENIQEKKDLSGIDNKILENSNQIKMLSGEFGMLMIDDKQEEANKVKLTIDNLKAENKKLESDKDKLIKNIDKLIPDKVKDLEKEVKKLEKESEKKKSEIAKLQSDTITSTNADFKPEFNINDQDFGNYFIKSESGGIIYKEKGMSLDKIDWYKASIYDLLEGVTRLFETYTNINSNYRVAFQEHDDYINLENLLLSKYQILSKESLDDLISYIGAYGGTSIYKHKILNLASDITGSSYNRKYWNIYWVAQLKNTISRALRDYNQITDGQDPDEYLASLDEKIDKLYKEIGESSNILDISPEVMDKYIDKAYRIISERRKEFSNYMNLVDGFASFGDLFNINIESVFIDEKKQKEIAEKASIIYSEEVVDRDEAAELVMKYQDKIDVYEEMIEEAEGEQKEMYVDKIEVYKEMIDDLKK